MRLTPPAFALLLAACHKPAPPPATPAAADPSPVTAMDMRPPLLAQQSGTTRLLQAVSAVNDTVAWVSGAGGAWAVTVNGGLVWRTGVVPGADSLEFRDIHAADARTAWLLAAGPGDRSRIYRTTDGGSSWTLQWTNRDPDAFFDCFAFWDRNSAIAFSDNVRGVFPVLRTDDGATWRLISDPASPSASPLPPATEGEGAFAASGTCVATHGRNAAWVATGAGKSSRILYTADRGKSWTSYPTPMVQGTATSGHTGIAFRDDGLHGLAVGGDVGAPGGMSDNVVLTQDGGRSWTVGGRPTFDGAVYGAAIAPGAGSAALTVAVGPRGASWSQDGGRSWMALDTLSYWSVGFASQSAGWMVGPGGRITRIGVSLVH